jgi:hypothetical protein
MSRKKTRKNPPARQPSEEARRPAAVPVLAWATVRTALSLFAVGWILIQAASAWRLLMAHFGQDLLPVAANVLELLRSLAMVVGIVYFLTGMGMTCVVPAASEAKRLAWTMIVCLGVSAVGIVLFNGATYQNQEIYQEIGRRINAAKNPPNPLPPSKEELDRLLDELWSPTTLNALLFTAVAAFCLAKILFTVCLWMLARHFRQLHLAGGFLLYLMAECLGMALALGVLGRLQPDLGSSAPLAVLTGNWYAVAAGSALCAWFLFNLFQVRRAITQSLLNPGG